ncbi:hypothetical protein EYF80_003944 [Liparis tanakae]|uniref:Uncharacterized protein n=1 Tax=Liparis tanakae TaxID=230148 RepID=A0A4Z2J6P7_9TELE|nr:hypothetical protein EYF80_003944 [Liparis tanakae]
MMHRARLPSSNPASPTPDGCLSHNAVRSQMPTEEVTNTLQVSVPLRPQPGVVVGKGRQSQVSKLLARAEEDGVLGVEDRGVAAGGVAAGLPVPLLGVQAEELMGAGVSDPGTPACSLLRILTSLESSCWLITESASSAACRLASATVCSILARSVLIISCALRSASETAFCNSDTACRFTSFTASSGKSADTEEVKPPVPAICETELKVKLIDPVFKATQLSGLKKFPIAKCSKYTVIYWKYPQHPAPLCPGTYGTAH